MSESIFKSNYQVLVVLLVFYFLNPFNYGFLFGYLLFTYLIFTSEITFKFLKPISLVLTIFALIYSCYYSFQPSLGSQFIFIYAIIPISFFTTGRLLINLNPKQITKIIFLIGLTLSAPSILSVLASINSEGFVTIKRDVPNIWTGEYEPATNTAGALILNMCIPAILIIKWRFLKSHWASFLALIIFIISAICVLRLGSRTHLVITFFTIFLAILFKLSKQGAVKNIILLLALFIIGNLAFTYFSIDQDSDLLSAYADRMESKKYGAASAGGRTWRWEKSIELLFEKPLGWNLEEVGHSHNLWFDVGRVGGLMSFLFLLLFSFKILQKTWVISFRKPIDDVKLAGILFIYGIGMNLLFFVEPIMEGYFNCFAMFCVLAGIIAELARIKVETSQQD